MVQYCRGTTPVGITETLSTETLSAAVYDTRTETLPAAVHNDTNRNLTSNNDGKVCSKV